MIARLALLLSLALVPAIARADCDAANKYALNFSDQAAATLAYGNRYTYSARNGAGATQNLTVDLAQNGLSSTTVSSRTMPEIGTFITGSNAALKTLTLGGIFSGRTTSLSGTTRVITMTVTFAQPVRDVTFSVYDVDFTSNQFRDWIQITGSSGPVALATPWGTSNAAGAAHSNGSSSNLLGSSITPILVAVSEAAGVGASDNNSDTGNVTATFAQPVTSITFKYGNYPLAAGETTTGQQAMAVGGVSYCPLPNVSVTKTSAPYAATGDARFAIPGADIVYTFVLTNSGGSPVDASSLVLTDILPAGITFFGGSFGGAATGPFEFTPGTSGLTLSNAGITYSADSGTTWTYQGTAGYDAAIKAIRLLPSGSLAANSSVTIRFRARVN